MMSRLVRVTFCVLLVAIVVLSLVKDGDATYRKPPFNGSIFGKRGTSNEYDTTGKAITALCEIANEACQTWFPGQENK